MWIQGGPLTSGQVGTWLTKSAKLSRPSDKNLAISQSEIALMKPTSEGLNRPCLINLPHPHTPPNPLPVKIVLLLQATFDLQKCRLMTGIDDTS